MRNRRTGTVEISLARIFHYRSLITRVAWRYTRVAPLTLRMSESSSAVFRACMSLLASRQVSSMCVCRVKETHAYLYTET